MWFKKRKKANAKETPKKTSANAEIHAQGDKDGTYDECSPVIVLAEGVCRRFQEKGLEGFFLSDFSSRYFQGFNKALSEDEQKTLTLAMQEILYYLEIFPDVILQIRHAYNNEDKTTTVGELKMTPRGKIMEITLQSNHDYYQTMANLIHLCVGYFMSKHDLNWNDAALNAKRADVIAVLVGFGDILLLGYQPLVYSVDSTYQNGNKTTTIRRNKLGYISEQEIRDLLAFRQSYRQKLLKEKEEKEKFLQARENCERNIALAKQLQNQLKKVDFHAIQWKSEEDYIEFQKVLLEYENADISDRLVEYELSFRMSNDAKKIEATNAQVTQLCKKMEFWLSIFQRNL